MTKKQRILQTKFHMSKKTNTSKLAEPGPVQMLEQHHRKPEKINKTVKCIMMLTVMTKD